MSYHIRNSRPIDGSRLFLGQWFRGNGKVGRPVLSEQLDDHETDHLYRFGQMLTPRGDSATVYFRFQSHYGAQVGLPADDITGAERILMMFAREYYP